ncbi:MAG: HAD family hydrolase [Polyangiales bacterium]
MAAPYFAFFDVDYTIVRGSTGTAFGLELVRAGLIGFADFARVAAWSTLYKLGLIDEVRIWHRATERLIGKPEDPIRRVCEVAHERRVRHSLYEDALTALAEHRDRGAEVALISAGPRYSVLAVAKELGIQHTATCWANVRDGLVHSLDGVEIPFGPMKRVFAERLCAEHGIDPRACWAYGDSRSDIEMLEYVGNPVAVNPKRDLRAVAEKRGWPIVQWSRTRPSR